jgi:hypothetical protein
MTTNAGPEFDNLEWDDETCNDACADLLTSRLCEICAASFFVCPKHEVTVEACGDCS